MTLSDKTIRRQRDWDLGRSFHDVEIRGCAFQNCSISLADADPANRSIYRNIAVRDCKAAQCVVGPAVFEDVLIENLEIEPSIITHAAAFKHVTFRGRIGAVRLSCRIPPVLDFNDGCQPAFDAANDAFYANVDWALDIRDAEFTSAEIERIPVNLIRRNPATQAIVPREKLLAGRWRQIDLTGTHLRPLLDVYSRGLIGDVILVAPARHPKYTLVLDRLKALRDAGVADLD